MGARLARASSRRRIVLAGNVTSYYAKQLAQHFLLKVFPAAALTNEIQVVPIFHRADADTSASG
jgi:hypothetical protein